MNDFQAFADAITKDANPPGTPPEVVVEAPVNVVERANPQDAPPVNHEQAAPVVPETPPAQPTINDELVAGYFKERYGIEHDIPAIVDRVRMDPNSVFANEQIKAINDWVAKTNRGIDDYFTINQLNVETMSDIEAIERNILINDPFYKQNPNDVKFELGKYDVKSLTAQRERLNKELQDIDPSDESAFEIRSKIAALDGQIEQTTAVLRRDAFNARNKLSEYKNSLNVPKTPAIDPVVMENHQRNSDLVANQFNSIPISYKFGDETASISVQLTEQEKAVIAQTIKNGNILKSEQEYRQVASLVGRQLAFDRIIESVRFDAYNRGQADLIKNGKAVQTQVTPGQAPVNVEKDVQSLKGLMDAFKF